MGFPVVKRDRCGIGEAIRCSVHLPFLRTGEGNMLTLTVVNRNDRRHSTKLYGGIAFPNGSEVTMTRVFLGKHTTHFTPADVVHSGLSAWVADVVGYPKRIRGMRECGLPPDAAGRLILTAGRLGLIPWSRLRKMDEGFGKGPPTVWHLGIAFGFAVGKGPATKQPERRWEFCNLLEEYTNPKLPNGEEHEETPEAIHPG